jgi:hypothetical protein
MVRASHTLCGIHRAGGFPLIALTAQALERCLSALQPLPPPLPTDALPALADAVSGLRQFLGRVRERRSFNATDVAIAAEIQQELEAVAWRCGHGAGGEEVTQNPRPPIRKPFRRQRICGRLATWPSRSPWRWSNPKRKKPSSRIR